MSAASHFDYIITGAGCAGLSLAMHMAASGQFKDRNILLLDKDPKKNNDRTWCYWEEEAGLFEPVVFRQWKHLNFFSEDFEKQLPIYPYTYKMIRGIDFYNHCLKELSKHNNFTLLFEPVESIGSDADGTRVIVNGEVITCDYIFNSILFEKPVLKSNEYWLLQHFKGWLIETERDQFDEQVATLMDFRISQEHGTAFCYVLPFNSKMALVEYTLFSAAVLEASAYDAGLHDYISRVLKIDNYKIADQEFGIIPMTNHRFRQRDHHIIHIGTAGGQTKGSSGYTFRFIQKHSKAIVQSLIHSGDPYHVASPARFQFYDSVLLDVLQKGEVSGRDIFTTLFRRNQTADVLRFLDNESSWKDELAIISTLPVLPFTMAAFRQIF